MYQKSTKRHQQAELTKDRIYSCACKLFSEQGFDNVTVEQVADAAGVSVGAFYHHFKNKQSIMATYYESLDTKYLEYQKSVLQADVSKDWSTAQKIRDFILYTCQMCVAWGVEHTRVIYPYMIGNKEFGLTMADRKRPYWGILLELIESAAAEGLVDDTLSAMQIAEDLTIICRGCIVDWCLTDAVNDIRTHSTSLVNSYLRGILKNASV